MCAVRLDAYASRYHTSRTCALCGFREKDNAIDEKTYAQSKYDMLRKQVSAMDFDTWTDQTTLHSDIDRIEKEIAAQSLEKLHKYNPLPPKSANRVHDLIVSKFIRLEELCFTYRSRLGTLQRYRCQPEIEKEFGSAEVLLQRYRSIAKENLTLRRREVRYVLDPLLKRRNLKQTPKQLVHCLLIAAQNELSSTRDVVRQVFPLGVAASGALADKAPASLDFSALNSYVDGFEPDGNNATDKPTSFVDVDELYAASRPRETLERLPVKNIDKGDGGDLVGTCVCVCVCVCA
jgi:hypothetical protein